MTNVIASLNQNHWNTLLAMKRAVRQYESRGDPCYDTAKEKIKVLHKDYIKEALANGASLKD